MGDVEVLPTGDSESRNRKRGQAWPRVSARDLAEVRYGYTASAVVEPVGPRFLRITDIRAEGVSWLDVPYCAIDEGELEKHRLREGDIVFARTGATTGKSYVVRSPPDSVCASYLIRLRPDKERVLAAFLGRFFESDGYWQQVRAGISGTAQGGFNAKKLSALAIPLPPLPEQHRIVEILEEQLSRIDAALEGVRLVREKAAQFRRSLLHAAFTGALTGEEIGEDGVPVGWASESIGDLVTVRYGKALPKAKRVEDGPIPVVGSSGIYAYTREPLASGDVIVVGRKGNVGDVQLFAEDIWPVDTVYFMDVPNGVDPRYFFYALLAQEMRQLDSSTSTPSLRRDDFEAVVVLLPPLPEQRRIVEILEEQLLRMDASLGAADTVEHRAAALRRSLLHAAFTGRLTEQWRQEHAHV